MFSETCDVSADGIDDHSFSFRKRFSVGDASGKRGDNRRKSAIRFRSKNDVVRSFLCHNKPIVHGGIAVVNLSFTDVVYGLAQRYNVFFR